MKKDERMKIISAVMEAVRTELPRMVREEFQSMVWKEIAKETENIENELEIKIEHIGFCVSYTRYS